MAQGVCTFVTTDVEWSIGGQGYGGERNRVQGRETGLAGWEKGAEQGTGERGGEQGTFVVTDVEGIVP